MPTVRRSIRQLAEMIDDPKRALREPEYWNEALCRRWLDHVDDLVHLDRRQARRAAIVGVRLALRVVRERQRRRLRRRSIVALSYAVLGSVYRASGDLERADRILARAAAVAASCLSGDVRAEVYLRRAYLRAYQAQRADGTFEPRTIHEALDLANLAVEAARSPVTSARSRNARAVVQLRFGELEAASHDGKWALEVLDPKKRPYDHVAALFVVVSAMARGERKDREEAAKYLEQLRNALPHRLPEIRARISWAEALLYIPDRQKKARANRLLNQARRKFISKSMKAEAVAVTAEMVRLKPEGAVPELCREIIQFLDPGPIRDLVENLRRVRVVERVNLAEELRGKIGGPGILPTGSFPVA